MATINTSLAPDAKPVGNSFILNSTWQKLFTVPNYIIPSEVYGYNTVTVDGSIELTAPILIVNMSSITQNVSLYTTRGSSNTQYYISYNIPVPAYDSIAIPLNGHLFLTNDTLNAKATSSNNSITDAVHLTISYTVGRAESNDIN
jgi:hypothetical protein